MNLNINNRMVRVFLVFWTIFQGTSQVQADLLITQKVATSTTKKMCWEVEGDQAEVHSFCYDVSEENAPIQIFDRNDDSIAFVTVTDRNSKEDLGPIQIHRADNAHPIFQLKPSFTGNLEEKSQISQKSPFFTIFNSSEEVGKMKRGIDPAKKQLFYAYLNVKNKLLGKIIQTPSEKGGSQWRLVLAPSLSIVEQKEISMLFFGFLGIRESLIGVSQKVLSVELGASKTALSSTILNSMWTKILGGVAAVGVTGGAGYLFYTKFFNQPHQENDSEGDNCPGPDDKTYEVDFGVTETVVSPDVDVPYYKALVPPANFQWVRGRVKKEFKTQCESGRVVVEAAHYDPLRGIVRLVVGGCQPMGPQKELKSFSQKHTFWFESVEKIDNRTTANLRYKRVGDDDSKMGKGIKKAYIRDLVIEIPISEEHQMLVRRSQSFLFRIKDLETEILFRGSAEDDSEEEIADRQENEEEEFEQGGYNDVGYKYPPVLTKPNTIVSQISVAEANHGGRLPQNFGVGPGFSEGTIIYLPGVDQNRMNLLRVFVNQEQNILRLILRTEIPMSIQYRFQLAEAFRLSFNGESKEGISFNLNRYKTHTELNWPANARKQTNFIIVEMKLPKATTGRKIDIVPALGDKDISPWTLIRFE